MKSNNFNISETFGCFFEVSLEWRNFKLAVICLQSGVALLIDVLQHVMMQWDQYVVLLRFSSFISSCLKNFDQVCFT